MNRRALLLRPTLGLLGLLGLAALGTLNGCGFQLQQPPRMAFETATLSGFSASSPLATELARSLEDAGVTVVETSAQAAAQRRTGAVPLAGRDTGLASGTHIVIQALNDQRQQTLGSATAYGQTREINLGNVLRFRVLRADGSVLLPASALGQTNIMTFNERDALAKQYEAESIHLTQQSELVRQVLRRLAAITPEQLRAPAATPVAAPPASSPRP